MKKKQILLPKLYKGLALFTPGGDLIYCVDPSKQNCWHIHLCLELQDILGLREPPHFLVPAYTATIDRWLDPQTKTLKTAAEIYPAVKRYQTLLNAIFETEDYVWKNAFWQEESCNPAILDRYREQFAPLWENHQLIVHFKPNQITSQLDKNEKNYIKQDNNLPLPMYILRLFVSGNNKNTEQTLESLYNVLEQGLGTAYTLKVIDILQHPEEAENHQITAIPTLIRVFPQPSKRIVGKLDDLAHILAILADY